MKKFLITFCLCLVSSLSMLLTGCASESQNLAKSLDDTITSLVYSVSSLDWADAELLNNIASDNIILNNQATINYATENEKVINDSSTIPYTQYNSTATFPAPHTLHYIPEQDYNYNEQQYMAGNLNTYNENMSGSKASRNTLSREKVSKISQNQNLQNMTINSLNSQLNSENPLETIQIVPVKYAIEAIEEQTNEVMQRLASLVQRRTNILLYVNALYNSKIVLSKDMITATNAYINIIRDNTAYLNSNKGIVANQLSHASSIKFNDNFSPLINAYVIRTNEAIETRLAKLDACILAIDSIIEILEANLDSSIIPDISGYISGTDNIINQNPILDNISENNQKISIENKNAEDNQKTDDIIAENKDNTKNLPESTNIIKNEQNIKIEENNMAEKNAEEKVKIKNETSLTEEQTSEPNVIATSSKGFLEEKRKNSSNLDGLSSNNDATTAKRPPYIVKT